MNLSKEGVLPACMPWGILPGGGFLSSSTSRVRSCSAGCLNKRKREIFSKSTPLCFLLSCEACRKEEKRIILHSTPFVSCRSAKPVEKREENYFKFHPSLFLVVMRSL